MSLEIMEFTIRATIGDGKTRGTKRQDEKVVSKASIIRECMNQLSEINKLKQNR